MAFRISLTGVKSKKIFLSFFVLASLFPILIAIFIMEAYITPLLGNEVQDLLSDAFYIGLSAMLFFPLLSFFLMYRWVNSLEKVTLEIMSKSTAVAKREIEHFSPAYVDDTIRAFNLDILS